jgi:hypothetical protein
MDKDKLIEIARDAENKSNNDLTTALTELSIEFDKTKKLIVDLTRHLDTVNQMFATVNTELNRRIIKQ